jgi:site-specific recombinase XerC
MSERRLEAIDSEAALRALVVLTAADRAERDPPPRVSTDRLLYEAGLTHAQIGAIVDEKADTSESGSNVLTKGRRRRRKPQGDER